MRAFFFVPPLLVYAQGARILEISQGITFAECQAIFLKVMENGNDVQQQAMWLTAKSALGVITLGTSGAFDAAAETAHQGIEVVAGDKIASACTQGVKWTLDAQTPLSVVINAEWGSKLPKILMANGQEVTVLEKDGQPSKSVGRQVLAMASTADTAMSIGCFAVLVAGFVMAPVTGGTSVGAGLAAASAMATSVAPAALGASIVIGSAKLALDKMDLNKLQALFNAECAEQFGARIREQCSL